MAITDKLKRLFKAIRFSNRNSIMSTDEIPSNSIIKKMGNSIIIACNRLNFNNSRFDLICVSILNKEKFYFTVKIKIFENSTNPSIWLKITNRQGDQIGFYKKNMPPELYNLCKKAMTYDNNKA